MPWERNDLKVKILKLKIEFRKKQEYFFLNLNSRRFSEINTYKMSVVTYTLFYLH